MGGKRAYLEKSILRSRNGGAFYQTPGCQGFVDWQGCTVTILTMNKKYLRIIYVDAKYFRTIGKNAPMQHRCLNPLL